MDTKNPMEQLPCPHCGQPCKKDGVQCIAAINVAYTTATCVNADCCMYRGTFSFGKRPLTASERADADYQRAETARIVAEFSRRS